MLRELAEAMEALTEVWPCVLVLEDLHWSDTATIEWLAYMARRRRPARLLVLGTYRPVETIARAHPVRAMVQELIVHGYGAELALQEWSEAGVAAYLAQRGDGAGVPDELARVLTLRTDGHPLFVVALVDELLRQRVLQVGPAGWALARGFDAMTVGVPPSIRHLLEHQVARLRPADQELLAVASVAGVEFAVAAVAASIQHTGEDIEVQCDALARQHQAVTEGADLRGTARSASPTRKRILSCSSQLMGHWDKHSVCLASRCWRGSICSRSWPSMSRISIVPWSSAAGMTLASMRIPWKPGCSGC